MPRILHVDDDPIWGEIVASYLKHNNFDIDHVTDKSQALKLVEKRSYDAAIVDLFLVGGGNGSRLGRRLERLGIPVLYLSSAASLAPPCSEAFDKGDLVKMPVTAGGVRLSAAIARAIQLVSGAAEIHA